MEWNGPIKANFTMTRAEMAAALDKVSFAISTEETRYYLNGIFMQVARPERGAPVCLRFVATDGHRLSLHDMPRPHGWSKATAPNGFRGVIIPKEACKTLGDLCKAKNIGGEVFTVEVNTTKVRFTLGNAVLIAKLIDGPLRKGRASLQTNYGDSDMAKLTKIEQKWLDDLQAVLDRCPSKRLGFYTIGDRSVTVFDRSKEGQIDALMMSGAENFFCQAVDKVGADLGQICFPANVHSTSG